MLVLFPPHKFVRMPCWCSLRWAVQRKHNGAMSRRIFHNTDFRKFKYSGPSSYDRSNIRTTWVTTKILVLTYDQSLELRPGCRSRPKRISACAVVNKDPRCVRKRQSQPRYACLWTFYNFLASALGKLLVFLVNYAHYTTLFIIKRLGKVCFGRFGTHYGYFHYFIWGKIVLTYDQLELRPALANELSS
jgi:hypothetical protein